MAKRVVVGMSGGVDSSVAAYLLKENGYDVVGLFMRNWEDDDVCAAEEDYADVRRVCAFLDIPYYSVDFSSEYMDNVFKLFLDEYAAGRTPNPDVLCNREIKFGPFKTYAKTLGADFIATGHYCGISHENGRNCLLKAKDAVKDQTYFLNQVREEQLGDVLFPLQDIEKPRVREIAKSLAMPTAEKKDSTGICFIGERKFKQFLETFLPAQPGDILSLDGEKVGAHDGVMYYTKGQRKGLNIGGRRGEEGRWYVVDKDVKNNVLYVSCGDETPLYSVSCEVSGLNWIGDAPALPAKLTARFRHRQPEQNVTVSPAEDGVTVTYDEPQRAVTEGQYAVFYDGSRCLGGGVIESVRK